jgi:hypothetical protein
MYDAILKNTPKHILTKLSGTLPELLERRLKNEGYLPKTASLNTANLIYTLGTKIHYKYASLRKILEGLAEYKELTND